MRPARGSSSARTAESSPPSHRDVHGEVVGINVALLDNDSGGCVGIGFAVPMHCVLELLPQLR